MFCNVQPILGVLKVWCVDYKMSFRELTGSLEKGEYFIFTISVV